MCGSFTCSKNTLVGLNLIYMLVSLIMIGVAVHGRVSGIVTSLPIVGGITACGVFLLFISVVGLVGALRHHQVMLFFYMVVLFLIFLIQFSVACAALAINENDEKQIILKAWQSAEKNTPSVIVQAERTFDCCGVGLNDDLSVYPKPTLKDRQWSDKHGVFNGTEYENKECSDHNSNTTECATCFSHINDKVNSGFNAAGGLGLFFSLTELIGGVVAARYRNQLDPAMGGLAGTPFAGGA
jgi:tetraspanin-13/31